MKASLGAGGGERRQHAAVRAKRIDNAAFIVLGKRLSIHLANGVDVVRLLVSDVDQGAEVSLTYQVVVPRNRRERDDGWRKDVHRNRLRACGAMRATRGRLKR
jgi:hypothetical protein